MSRLVAAVTVLVVAVVGWSGTADAHATLVATEPSAAANLSTAPRQVVVRFSEPVEVASGAIRVYDGQGRRVDPGSVTRPGGRGDAVALTLPALGDGGFVVTWRVTSADSHPVHGAFTFRVGAGPASDTDSLARRLLAAEGGSSAVGAVGAAVRAVSFGAVVVAVGGSSFVLTVRPAGRADQRTRRVLVAATATAAATALLGIGVQGAYAAALPLARVADPDVVSPVLHTRFGALSLTRFGLLGVAALAVAGWRTRPRLVRPVVAVCSVGVVATIAGSGHATSGPLRPAAFVIDVVHLLAAAVWLGGLTMLATALCRIERADENDRADLGATVSAFSKVALVCVAVLVATGTFQSWRQVRSLDALRQTTYGQLLLVKVGLFCTVLAAAWSSRRWTRRHLGPDGDRGRIGLLRRSVLVEVAGAVGVLAATAVLVNAVPARDARAAPVSLEIEAQGLLIDMTVDPAKAGPVDIHLSARTPEGRTRDVAEAGLLLTLPAQDIGPLSVPLQRTGPNHFSAYRFTLPLPGRWQATAHARVGDLDKHRGVTTFTVR